MPCYFVSPKVNPGILLPINKARKCWTHWDYILQAICFTVGKIVAAVCFDPASRKDIKWPGMEGDRLVAVHTRSGKSSL